MPHAPQSLIALDGIFAVCRLGADAPIPSSESSKVSNSWPFSCAPRPPLPGVTVTPTRWSRAAST